MGDALSVSLYSLLVILYCAQVGAQIWHLNFIEFLSSIRLFKVFYYIYLNLNYFTFAGILMYTRNFLFFDCGIAGNRQAKTLVTD